MPHKRMTREEALASLAEYQRKHPGSKHIRKGYAALGDDLTFSRFVRVKGEHKRAPAPRNVPLPTFGNPSIEAGRSLFYRKGVKRPDEMKNILVSGFDNVKIGRDVRKGKLFRGYWIYTLSLEERATCPRSCHHWRTCYGNGMPYAKRVDHTATDFLPRLTENIERLLAKPKNGQPRRVGILIRLHALGDFYSVEYVDWWASILANHPNVAVFGYTAHDPESEIGDAIDFYKTIFGRRFAIRWSNGKAPNDNALPIIREEARPLGAFVCPEQTNRVDGCGKCGLCWNTDKDVAFLEH